MDVKKSAPDACPDYGRDIAACGGEMATVSGQKPIEVSEKIRSTSAGYSTMVDRWG